MRFARLTAGGSRIRTVGPSTGAASSTGYKKSVEQLLDAKDEAWPIGRQKSQAVLPFYEKRGT